MRVLITGGLGLIGKAVMELLLHHNMAVRLIDLPPQTEVNSAVEYISCDVLNYDDLLKNMQGCDAVIHLGAIRSPNMAAGHTVFQVNVAGTFNVYEAAAQVGIRRVVQASSINAIGAFYNLTDIHTPYFPVDEAYPRITTDPYSLSKQMVEDIGDYYWRRDGISGVSLRFPGVYAAGYIQTEAFQQRQSEVRQALDEIVQLPEAEQQARMTEVKQRVLEFRKTRPFEFQPDKPQWGRGAFLDDPLFLAEMVDRFNFWAYIDERDAAQSLLKGLTAEYTGHHPLFVNAVDTYISYDTPTLLRLFFPDITHFKSDLAGSAAVVSIERARRLIGFSPDYSITSL